MQQEVLLLLGNIFFSNVKRVLLNQQCHSTSFIMKVLDPSKLLQGSPSGKCVIPNIQYKDRGAYKCVAANSAGDGLEQFVIITVKGK